MRDRLQAGTGQPEAQIVGPLADLITAAGRAVGKELTVTACAHQARASETVAKVFRIVLRSGAESTWAW